MTRKPIFDAVRKLLGRSFTQTEVSYLDRAIDEALREAMVETVEQLAKEMQPMKFKLGARSVARLAGVHPDLRKVVERAIEITDVDFTVLEGLRSKTRQRQLVNSGASKTMNSRHLTGHAVDLGAYVGGEVSWDWPLYYKIADAMKQAADEMNQPIEWGGDWRTFKDGPHYQLPWKNYPA